MTMEPINVAPAALSIDQQETVLADPAPAAPPTKRSVFKRYLWLAVACVALAGVASSVLLSQKLASMQEHLARQSADATTHATEARMTAKQAQELSMQTAAKLALMEARLSEVSLQRSQLEELMQSLSRSRDENLVVDIESAIRLAQQQAQLTGGVEPLLAALKSAQLRVERAAQPRLAPLLRAIEHDVLRVEATAVADTPSLLTKLDELVLLVDDLPVANAAPLLLTQKLFERKAQESVFDWWGAWWQLVRKEFGALVRVGRIDNPEAVLLLPEQSFFLRENLKLRLLNARLGLLSRQTELVRSDLSTVATSLDRYFDSSARKTQVVQALLQQVHGQTATLELPRVDETLAALATAAAGR